MTIEISYDGKPVIYRSEIPENKTIFGEYFRVVTCRDKSTIEANLEKGTVIEFRGDITIFEKFKDTYRQKFVLGNGSMISFDINSHRLGFRHVTQD